MKRLILSLAALAALSGCNKQTAGDAGKIPHYDLSPAANARYLADYAAKPGVFKTEDGLEYRILKSGTGKAPQSGADMVTVCLVLVTPTPTHADLRIALAGHPQPLLIDARGDLRSFRILQRQPAQQGRSPEMQLHRFMGTRSGRKSQYARLLADAVDLTRVPRPLDGVLAYV